METVLHCQINNGVISYDWTPVEQALASVTPCSFPLLFAQTPYKLNIVPHVQHHWIEKKGVAAISDVDAAECYTCGRAQHFESCSASVSSDSEKEPKISVGNSVSPTISMCQVPRAPAP